MQILNTSPQVYNWQNPTRTAEFAGSTVITATGTLTIRFLYGSATFSGATFIEANGNAILAGASVFRGKTTITARANTRLPLVTPEPILNEVAENAFAKRYYSARLLDNLNNEINIISAVVEAPRNTIGKRVSINVAKKDLSLITAARTYTFQIGTRETPTGAITWQTIVQNGKLNSRNFALGQNGILPADSLSFGTIEPLKNRLNKFPLENIILYNSRRTSVEIAASDVIRDVSGAMVTTNTVAINYMTVRDVLDYVRKKTGFSQVVTNIPNYEITRADFPITASYLQAISSIIGIFEPLIFTVGTQLYILDKTAAIPDEFAPRPLQNYELSSWTVSIPEAAEIDGYLVSYAADETNANYWTERLVQTTEQTGNVFDDDFTRIETNTIYREWRSFAAPDEILRSEVVSIQRETYIDFLTLASRRTETHRFDSQGRRTGSQITQLGLVPDLANSGVPSLQTVREENQTVSYTTDPKNPRRSLQSKIQTVIRGLVSVDSDNQYFDPETGEQADFRQDFLEAHKAGNLAEGQTTEFAPVKTITETLLDLGNGQYQMSVSTVDHLRKTETNAFSEPKTGDASILSSASKQSQILVLKDGLTLTTRPGNAIETISIGELPLYFGIPLIERRLANREAQKQSGNVGVIGYSASIERGTFFRLADRENENAGKYITAGFRLDISALGDGAQILTTIEAEEI